MLSSLIIRLDTECATIAQTHFVSTESDISAIAMCLSDDILSVPAVEYAVDNGALPEVETTVSDEESAIDLHNTAEICDDRNHAGNAAVTMMQISFTGKNDSISEAAMTTPALAMTSILIKTRKPRRKGDKPLVKMILSDPNQMHSSQREGIIEYPEPSAEGLKKKNALESLKQAQGLFKFIPRGTTIAESNSSLKVCRGVKGHRQLSEAISSETLDGEVNAEPVPALTSGISTAIKLPAVAVSSEIAISQRSCAEVQEICHVQLEDNQSNTGVNEKEVKPKIKPKLKDERKKHGTLSLDNTAAHQVIQAMMSGDSSVTSAAASSSSSSLEGSEEIHEKLHTKRKYTFQQPLVRRPSVLRQQARLSVETSDSDCGPCYQGGDKTLHASSLTLVRSDSMETDSNLATDESAAPIEDEEESPRASIAHDDMDMGDGITAPKTTRYEKKENVKRPGRGESKECSMTEVPGRHLLGPKMLAFMKAFPEGDVIGNDDVETSRTQRIRMESWLQALKGDSGSQTNIAQNVDDDDVTDLKYEIEKIKTDLLKGIEEKLTKAGTASGRGSGGSSVLLKPGMVQILLPYEVRHNLNIFFWTISPHSLLHFFLSLIFCSPLINC